MWWGLEGRGHGLHASFGPAMRYEAIHQVLAYASQGLLKQHRPPAMPILDDSLHAQQRA